MADNLVKKMTGRKWGRWWLDATSPPSLNIDMLWYPYEIILSRCRTARERRLWLEHMAVKRYINRQDLLDLRRAFDDLVAAGILPANEVLLREKYERKREVKRQ